MAFYLQDLIDNSELVAEIPTIPYLKSVTPKSDYILELNYEDGVNKIYNAKKLLQRTPYKSLKNSEMFENVKIMGSSLYWDDEIDISSEELYENGETVS